MTLANGYFKQARVKHKMTTATIDTPHIGESVEDILALARPFRDITSRGISERVCRALGIRTRVDEFGDTVAWYFPYYKLADGEPVLVGFKRKTAANAGGKSVYSTIGDVDVNCLLFGAVINDKTTGKPKLSRPVGKPRIIITEGEFDCAACMEAQLAFGKEGMGFPVFTSIGFGTANAVQHISARINTEFLSVFEKPVIAFDNDCATETQLRKGVIKGQEALKAVADYLGENNISVCALPPEYDPNDLWLEKRGQELFWGFTKPKPYSVAGFIEYSQIAHKATQMPSLGRPFPWPDLTRLTLGRRFGEGFYFGAGVKQGKSELLNQMVQHILETEDAPPAVFKFEEEPHITCKKLAGKLRHKQFTNPEKVLFIDENGNEHDVWGNPIPQKLRHTYFTEQELTEACESVGDRVIYYNNYGAARWDDVAEKIRYAVTVRGSKDIFIDPLTRLTAGMTAADANAELERIADEISTMSKDLGFTYYFFCHLKAPLGGKPHEKGGAVESVQFTGSRAMMRAAYYMIGLERNKSDDLPEIVRNMSNLVLLEDRAFGRTGRVALYYDNHTGDYRQPTADELKQYDIALNPPEGE